MSATTDILASPRYRFFPNVMAVQERRFARRARRLGMRPTQLSLGADTVHLWHSAEAPSRERPPVMLLHGFGASALWQWPEQLEALCRDYTVIMPDLLWFGDSVSRDTDFSLGHQVEAMMKMLDRLGVGRLHALIGLSYGGIVGWELATRQPLAVERTVIVASPGPVYSRADYLALLERLGVSALDELLLPRHPDDVIRLMEIAYRRQPWTPSWVRLQVIEAFCEQHRQEKAALLHSLLDNIETLRAEARPLATPALLMWGSDDPIFPLELGQKLAGHIGDQARLNTIAGARHAANLEYPRLFNEALLGFLRD